MYGFCAQVQQLTSLVGTYFLRLLTYALSFYRSKSFWTRLNWLAQVQFVLDQTKNNFSLLNFTF